MTRSSGCPAGTRSACGARARRASASRCAARPTRSWPRPTADRRRTMTPCSTSCGRAPRPESRAGRREAQSFVARPPRRRRADAGRRPHYARAVASLGQIRALIAAGAGPVRGGRGRSRRARGVRHLETAFAMLKVEVSELAVATVNAALRATGLAGYRDDSPFTMGRRTAGHPVLADHDPQRPRRERRHGRADGAVPATLRGDPVPVAARDPRAPPAGLRRDLCAACAAISARPAPRPLRGLRRDPCAASLTRTLGPPDEHARDGRPRGTCDGRSPEPSLRRSLPAHGHRRRLCPNGCLRIRRGGAGGPIVEARRKVRRRPLLLRMKSGADLERNGYLKSFPTPLGRGARASRAARPRSAPRLTSTPPAATGRRGSRLPTSSTPSFACDPGHLIAAVCCLVPAGGYRTDVA